MPHKPYKPAPHNILACERAGEPDCDEPQQADLFDYEEQVSEEGE